MSKRDYYDVLGIAKNASDDDIKKAYRKMASLYHPDKVTDASEKAKVEEKFKEAKEAYEKLSDSETRRQYDSYGHNSSRQSDAYQSYSHIDPAEFQEIFNNIFRGKKHNFNFQENGFANNAPQTLVINISLSDAYTGKIVRVDKDTTLSIPSGVRPQTRLYAGGKMYRIDIQPHNKFKRSNDDLLVDASISAMEAMVGIPAIIEHLDGTKLEFKIPNGIQPGQIIKLSGKGMKNPELNKTGDLLIRISITIPKGLTDEEKTAIRSMIKKDTIDI